MEKTIKTSISKNDVVLCICDAFREFGDEDEMVVKSLAECGKPCILAVNKTDIASKENVKKIKEQYLEYLGEVPIFEMSAKNGNNTKLLLEKITELLPKGTVSCTLRTKLLMLS